MYDTIDYKYLDKLAIECPKLYNDLIYEIYLHMKFVDLYKLVDSL